jgi:hypothetical protein
MAAKFIRLSYSTGEEVFVRPEVVMAFGVGPGFPKSAWISLWGSDLQHWVKETCTEIATLLNESPR